MRKFSCEKEKRARNRQQKSDETGRETKRREKRGRGREEEGRGERGGKERRRNELLLKTRTCLLQQR